MGIFYQYAFGDKRVPKTFYSGLKHFSLANLRIRQRGKKMKRETTTIEKKNHLPVFICDKSISWTLVTFEMIVDIKSLICLVSKCMLLSLGKLIDAYYKVK